MTSMDKKAVILKQLMACAEDYLLSCKEISLKTKDPIPNNFRVNKKLIKENMKLWQEKYDVTSKKINAGGKKLQKHLFREMLFYITLSYNRPNILGNRTELESLFKSILFDYDPEKVKNEYTQAKLTKILQGKTHKGHRLELSSLSQKTWQDYLKSIMSSAQFFSEKNNCKKLINSFKNDNFQNPERQPSKCQNDPIKILTKNIYYVGPAIASNYIKELGFCNFVKPDTHVIAICEAAGLIKKQDAKKTCQLNNEIVEICKTAKVIPYEFDRLIWMVGSGLFVVNSTTENKKHYIYVKTDKDTFIKKLKKI